MNTLTVYVVTDEVTAPSEAIPFEWTAPDTWSGLPIDASVILDDVRDAGHERFVVVTPSTPRKEIDQALTEVIASPKNMHTLVWTP